MVMSSHYNDILYANEATMSFSIADTIRKSLHKKIHASELGYPNTDVLLRQLRKTLAIRMQENFNWVIEPHRIELLGDVLQGIYLALQIFSSEGDAVITPDPVYHHFLKATLHSRRKPVINRLALTSIGYQLDTEELEHMIKTNPTTRLLLLCNPHNPTGRVFSRTELHAIAEIAARYNIIIVADEIHADIVYPSHTHTPIASLSPEIAKNVITLTSASKAFNIAGLRCAVAIFGSEKLQQQFLNYPEHLRITASSLGIEATLAAWRDGETWLKKTLTTLEFNRRFLKNYIEQKKLPDIRCHIPEATFFAWLDCRNLLQPNQPPDELFLCKAGIALTNGAIFGQGGEGFLRLNFAKSPEYLEKILERMRTGLF